MVFVDTGLQTRETGTDMVSMMRVDGHAEQVIEYSATDPDLSTALCFRVAYYHSTLNHSDKHLIQRCFSSNHIRVLVIPRDAFGSIVMNPNWQSSWTPNSRMVMNIASLTIPLLTLFACFTPPLHVIYSVPLARNHSTHTSSLSHSHWRVKLINTWMIWWMLRLPLTRSPPSRMPLNI